MNFDRELKELRNSYNDIKWELTRVIDKGNAQIRELERIYSSNVGKAEDAINKALNDVIRQVDNIISDLKKQMEEYKNNKNSLLRDAEVFYLKKLDAKRQSLLNEFKSEVKSQFIVKGEL